MPQSLAKLYVHLVFSTKYRTPFLQDAEMRKQVYAIQGQALGRRKAAPIRINGTADHVHLLFLAPRDVALSPLVSVVKTESTRWLHAQGNTLAQFNWQIGYAAFSVSHSSADAVVRYIDNQESHHERRQFEDELRELCRKHELSLDERFAWD